MLHLTKKRKISNPSRKYLSYCLKKVVIVGGGRLLADAVLESFLMQDANHSHSIRGEEIHIYTQWNLVQGTQVGQRRVLKNPLWLSVGKAMDPTRTNKAFHLVTLQVSSVLLSHYRSKNGREALKA